MGSGFYRSYEEVEEMKRDYIFRVYKTLDPPNLVVLSTEDAEYNVGLQSIFIPADILIEFAKLISEGRTEGLIER